MKIRTVVLLGSLVAACLVLLTLQTRGYGSTAGDAFAVVTAPIQTALAKASRSTFGIWTTYLDWKNVRAENRRLREEVQELRVQALRVSETDDENRRLRRLLALQEQLPLTTLSGEIIAREWGGWIRSLTVNRGRGDNVPRLTAVISPAGLIGRVVDVRTGASIVQVLTDPASTVGAHVLRTRTRASSRAIHAARCGSNSWRATAPRSRTATSSSPRDREGCSRAAFQSAPCARSTTAVPRSFTMLS